MRPLPDLFQPCTQSEKYMEPSGAKSMSVVSVPQRNFSGSFIAKLAPCGMRSKDMTPEWVALPRNSHRKKWPSYSVVRPLPG